MEWITKESQFETRRERAAYSYPQPPSSVGTEVSFSEGKRIGHEADQWPHLVLGLRMRGVIAPSRHVLSHRAQRQYYLHFTYITTRIICNEITMSQGCNPMPT